MKTTLGKDYKLVAFDLDGTLVDTQEDIARALRAILLDAGLPDTDSKTVLSAIGGGAKNAVHRLTGFTDEKLDYYTKIFVEKYDEMCADNTTLYEGAMALIKRLKEQGKVLAVITMKARKPTVKILEAHGIDVLLDDVISIDDVEKSKPDPSSFFKLLDKYGIDPKDALMIGDTTTDIKYAKNAGVDVVAAAFGYGITQDLLDLSPEYTVNSLKEL